ncbi:MAG: DUF3011 domain-containing protein [Deltaproteobacteria bacterium]|nr:DUF3011 domain-containing protein [Deltaproteobacteria bacterium]
MACARSLALWGLCASLLACAEVASAQRYRPPAYPARSIRCASESHEHAYCRTYAQGRVRLERRLSKAPCREYDTWGADRDGGGVWVREGCRAIFTVVPWGSGPIRPGPGAGPVGVYRITCKSDRFRPQYCPMPRWGWVRLERRLSDAPCRQYDTWGADGGGIWVDRGCAATFSVRY